MSVPSVSAANSKALTPIPHGGLSLLALILCSDAFVNFYRCSVTRQWREFDDPAADAHYATNWRNPSRSGVLSSFACPPVYAAQRLALQLRQPQWVRERQEIETKILTSSIPFSGMGFASSSWPIPTSLQNRRQHYTHAIQETSLHGHQG
jgi:hypothetical protein